MARTLAMYAAGIAVFVAFMVILNWAIAEGAK